MKNITIFAERDEPRLKVAVTISDESTMADLVEAFRTIAIGLGYAHETVAEYLEER